jgi:hypothetical protein
MGEGPQQLEEARNTPPLEDLETVWFCQHQDFELVACKTINFCGLKKKNKNQNKTLQVD